MLRRKNSKPAPPGKKDPMQFWGTAGKKVMTVVCAATVAGAVLLTRNSTKPAQAEIVMTLLVKKQIGKICRFF